MNSVRSLLQSFSCAAFEKMELDDDVSLLELGNFIQQPGFVDFQYLAFAPVFPPADENFGLGDAVRRDGLLAVAPDPATQPLPGLMPPPQLSAAPNRRKARTLRDRDWDPMKDRIVHLYRVEGKSLRDVQRTVEQEFRFEATYVALTTPRP